MWFRPAGATALAVTMLTGLTAPGCKRRDRRNTTSSADNRSGGPVPGRPAQTGPARPVRFCGRTWTPATRNVACANHAQVSLTPLKNLPGLTGLSVDGGHVTGLETLGALEHLNILSLNRATFDLAHLGRLARLTHLSLQACPTAKNLAPLRGLNNLKSLSLAKTPVRDLSPLAAIPGLKKLYLNGCTQVADITPLSRLTGLTVLFVSGTAVRDISPLSSLSRLQYLDISHTGVTDLTPLAGHTGLKAINITGTAVRDLSPLSRSVNIGSIEMDQTAVTTLAPVTALRKLSRLTFNINTMKDLKVLKAFPKLKYIFIKGRKPTPAERKFLEKIRPGSKIIPP